MVPFLNDMYVFDYPTHPDQAPSSELFIWGHCSFTNWHWKTHKLPVTAHFSALKVDSLYYKIED